MNDSFNFWKFFPKFTVNFCTNQREFQILYTPKYSGISKRSAFSSLVKFLVNFSSNFMKASIRILETIQFFNSWASSCLLCQFNVFTSLLYFLTTYLKLYWKFCTRIDNNSKFSFFFIFFSFILRKLVTLFWSFLALRIPSLPYLRIPKFFEDYTLQILNIPSNFIMIKF